MKTDALGLFYCSHCEQYGNVRWLANHAHRSWRALRLLARFARLR